MKFRNQQGSTVHIVIIIVLVVAVLGALGFVFWQNFVSKPTDQRAIKENVASQNVSYLTFDEFGVRIPYDSNTDTYSVDSFGQVSSKKADDACGREVNVGYVSRYGIGERLPEGAPYDGITYAESLKDKPSVTIGDYFYSLQNAPDTATCADAATEDGAAINTIKRNATLDFQDAFVKLEAVE